MYHCYIHGFPKERTSLMHCIFQLFFDCAVAVEIGQATWAPVWVSHGLNCGARAQIPQLRVDLHNQYSIHVDGLYKKPAVLVPVWMSHDLKSTLVVPQYFGWSHADFT